jgi:hypothetical protein
MYLDVLLRKSVFRDLSLTLTFDLETCSYDLNRSWYFYEMHPWFIVYTQGTPSHGSEQLCKVTIKFLNTIEDILRTIYRYFIIFTDLGLAYIYVNYMCHCRSHDNDRLC